MDYLQASDSFKIFFKIETMEVTNLHDFIMSPYINFSTEVTACNNSNGSSSEEVGKKCLERLEILFLG